MDCLAYATLSFDHANASHFSMTEFPLIYPRRRRRSSTIGDPGGGGDDYAASGESGLQLSSLIPSSFAQSATTSSTCSAVSSVRLCDDTFSYTNSSIGTGDSIAAELLCFSPEPTDAEEEEAEDVPKKTPKKVSQRKGRFAFIQRRRTCICSCFILSCHSLSRYIYFINFIMTGEDKFSKSSELVIYRLTLPSCSQI